VRTFAAVAFIAGVAVTAIWVARIPTVADGRVLEAEILPAFRGQGVVGLACDRTIPVGRDGARFGCIANLSGGGRQRLDCTLERDGRFACAPGSGVMRDESAVREPGEPPEPREQNAPPRDPWGN
jgi:hypothetical protein